MKIVKIRYLTVHLKDHDAFVAVGPHPALDTRLTHEAASLVSILLLAHVNTAIVTFEAGVVPAQAVRQADLLFIV